MNHSYLIVDRNRRRAKILPGLLSLALSVSFLAACQTTHQVSEKPDDFSGFLGDYSMLTKGDSKEANYLYVDESVKFDKYTSVYVKPIELWKSDDPDSALGKLTPDDQQLLVSLLNTALVQELQKNYTIVSQPGPNVLVIHAAITDSKKSKPAINLVSTVMPIGMVLSAGKRVNYRQRLGCRGRQCRGRAPRWRERQTCGGNGRFASGNQGIAHKVQWHVG